MNLLASYNWIKEHVALPISAEEFARRISLCGPAVERLHPQALLYDKMVVGQIRAVKPHPNADKLRLVAVDVGTNAPLEVVCGGSNLAPGMKIAVALLGAKVRWHGQGDLIELGPAEIRGVKSDGMICGANEIGLGDAFPHAEKEILDLSWCKAKPGTSLAKALDLEDTVFDIEVTTNRPDAFSMVGMAREAAAILHGKFLWKETVLPSLPKAMTPIPLAVKNHATKLCTRYQAVVMTDVTVGPSPWWMKKRLLLAGLRPINTIVDITNYVMLELGQPMHAFDYDELEGNEIVVRTAKAGEKMLALDGKEYVLADGQLVIADAMWPIAVAGVMGGEDTGVREATKTIVFEAATFDPVSVRRTARALNLHSDSSLRFEKGLSEETTSAALARAVELCQEVACGRVASAVTDLRSAPHKKVKFSFRPEKAEELIGVAIPKKEMLTILKSLGFSVGGTGKKIEVTVPHWRERDIEGERDFAEEIARVHGYHNLPSVMPAGVGSAIGGRRSADGLIDVEDRAKFFFKGAGCTEVINYSLVPASHFEKCDWKIEDTHALRIANPLSADFEYMRVSLIPGVLQTIKENQGLFPEGRLFELSRTYHKKDGSLPAERLRLALAVYGSTVGDELFRAAKGMLEAYANEVHVGLTFSRREDSSLWHPGRAVDVVVDGDSLGFFGEVHPVVLKRFGIDGRVAAFEIDFADLHTHQRTHARYVPIPQFPSVLRDLALMLDERTEFGDLHAAISGVSALLKDVELFDVYRGKGVDAGKKSLAIHLTFSALDRTLTAEEVDAEVAGITKGLAEKFGATVRT